MSDKNYEKTNNTDRVIKGAVIAEFKKKIEKEKILSCLISQGDTLELEYYKNRKVAENVQTINSCTKSVVSALIGILIDKGGLESVHVPITEFFGDIIGRQADERLRKLTIEHLLTMTPGFDWPEFGEWNCFAPMVYSNDIVKFVLERSIISEPGKVMNYNSGCSHLLAAIIQKVTGTSAHDYAKEQLFKPLGIVNSTWHERQGISLGADGLRITSRDMLKLGGVFLNNGSFRGRQIVSEEWVKESTTPRYKTYEGIGHYAYHWWVSYVIKEEQEVEFYFALGFGGQYIIVVPQFELVTVMTSRLYNDSLRPMRLFKEFVEKL